MIRPNSKITLMQDHGLNSIFFQNYWSIKRLPEIGQGADNVSFNCQRTEFMTKWLNMHRRTVLHHTSTLPQEAKEGERGERSPLPCSTSSSKNEMGLMGLIQLLNLLRFKYTQALKRYKKILPIEGLLV